MPKVMTKEEKYQQMLDTPVQKLIPRLDRKSVV